MQSHLKSYFFCFLAGIVVSFLAAGVPLRAQTVNSLVEGVVEDSSGAVVPGTQLTLTNVDTGIAQTTQSNRLSISPSREIFVKGFQAGI